MKMPDWDVIVVGAGPAGSVSAAELAKRGFRVLLLDRASFPRNKACAEYLSPGIDAVARRLGFAAALQAAGPYAVPGMEIVSPGGKVLRVEYRTRERSHWAATLPRRVLDTVLVNHAVRHGAQLETGVLVREPIIQSGIVAGVVAGSSGVRRSYSAHLTIVADGNRSVIAGALGLAARPRWPVRLGLVAHFEGCADLRDGFGQMHVGHNGYCGVAPLGNGCFNVAVVVRSDAVQRSGMSPARFFDEWIAHLPALRKLLAASTRSTPVRGVGPIGARAKRASVGGALLVGDAAGFFDPFTGEGIYRAIRSAELATGVAAEGLRRQDLSSGFLRVYDERRQNEFRRKHVVTALVQGFVQFPSLMEYALPRLSARADPLQRLGAVLGDCEEASRFLNPGTLWGALRP